MRNPNPRPLPIISLPSQIVDIAAGGWHSLALAEDGSLWSFGSNGNGQLGYISDVKMIQEQTHRSPTRITTNLEGRLIKKIGAGDTSSFALLEDKEKNVFAWGNYFQRPPAREYSLFHPSPISKIPKSRLLIPFGPGGRSSGYAFLEHIQRSQIISKLSL